MLPDIGLNECISMVTQWFRNANKMKKDTDDFEFVILAHQYKEIIRHLEAYRELKEAQNNELLESCVELEGK